MHSFKPSLSFLLSLLILPLLQSQHISLSDPPASLAFAQAAGLEGKDGLPVYGVENSNATSEDSQISAAHHGSSPSTVRISHGKIGRDFLARMERNQLLSLHPGRRAANAQFTHYVTGLGACGTWNVPSDYVVALNAEQWDNGAHCYAPITITIRGKSVQAKIVDRCELCGFNNLDFTDGLFAVWGGDGVIQGDWEYGTGPATSPPPKKSTTTPPPPKPTSTKIPPTTSKPVPTSSTTKITPSSSTHSSSSTAVSSTSQSTSASSTSSPSKTSTGSLPDPTSQEVQNLELLYLANLGIGGIAFSSLQN